MKRINRGFLVVVMMLIAVSAMADIRYIIMRRTRNRPYVPPVQYWTNTITRWIDYNFQTTNVTQTLDVSGNAIHGSNLNNLIRQEWTNEYGRTNYWYNFNPAGGASTAQCFVSTWITQSLSDGTTDSTPYTVSAWVNNANNTSSVAKYIIGVSRLGIYTYPYWGIALSGTNYYLLRWWGVDSYDQRYCGYVKTGEWQHVALTFNGTGWVWYLDGINKSIGYFEKTHPTGWTNMGPANVRVTVGALQADGNQAWRGQLDSVHFYTNRYLSAGEVQIEMTNCFPLNDKQMY